MSPANSASPAWLSVRLGDSLPEQVTTGIGPVATKAGFVPDVARLLAISPDHFTGWWRYFDEPMGGPSGAGHDPAGDDRRGHLGRGPLPCCQAVHAAPRLRFNDRVLADRLAVSYRHVELPARDRVMLDFAVKLTCTPEACEEGDVVRLRGGGFGDADVLHMVEVTAIFNCNVCLAMAAGLFPDAGSRALARTAHEEG